MIFFCSEPAYPFVVLSLCEEFLIGLDRAFSATEDCCVGCFDIAKEIQDFSYWFHMTVGHFAI
jgi:hypothetical protein